MITRNQVTKTLKAFPLNSRGYERSEHPRIAGVWITSTLEESSTRADGALFPLLPAVRRSYGRSY